MLAMLGAGCGRAVSPLNVPNQSTVVLTGGPFLGDAVTSTVSGGFAPARRGFSSDSDGAARALAALWPRLPAGAVKYACTAHARCAAYTPAFLEDVAR